MLRFNSLTTVVKNFVRPAKYSACGNSNLYFIQRSLQSTRAGFAKAVGGKDKKNITPLGWLLLIVPGSTFALGCWQVKRKAWKENLIREMAAKTQAAPVPLPENLDDLNEMEYLSVAVRGKFLHDREIYLGPRSFLRHGDADSRSSLFTQQDGSIGYLVITPFKLSDRDDTILVNRGWVSRAHLNPETRQSGQISGETDLIGVVRLGEARPQFSPSQKSGPYLYRDLQKMCSQTGASPVFLDAKYESTVPGGPIGGQTRVTLRNEHLSYLLTWFTLSAATSILWYRKIVLRKGF